MMRELRADKYIVNVSSKEGQFNTHKSGMHPHTNMAKAALNMMTRTAAPGYARDRIFMNCVDPGWVSHENPSPVAERMSRVGFHPPVACADAASRVCDPIFTGISGKGNSYGYLFVHYKPSTW